TAIEATNHGELLYPLRRDTSIAVWIYFDIIQVPMLGNIAVSFLKPMAKLFTAFSNHAYKTFHFIHRTMQPNNRARNGILSSGGVRSTFATLEKPLNMLYDDTANYPPVIPACKYFMSGVPGAIGYVLTADK